MKINTRAYLFLIPIIIMFLVISSYLYGYYKLGDDTYIYLRYAKNLINHLEISFNPGEKSYGFTSPLWLFLIIGMYSFFHKLNSIPEILSLVFSLSTLVVWFFIIKQRTSSNLILILSLMIIAFDPNLLKHSHLGMEAPLSYFLSSIIILLFLEYSRKPRPYVLGVVFGFYNLVRPESFILAIIIIVALYKYSAISLNSIIKIVVTAVIVVLPWYAFSIFYFKTLLPYTSLAKGLSFQIGRNFLMQFKSSLKIIAGNYFIILFFDSILISILFFKIKIAKTNSYLLLTIIILFAYILLYSFIINNELVYARYYAITFPFLMMTTVFLINNNIVNKKSILIILVIIITTFAGLSYFYSNINRSLFLSNENMENKIVEWVKKNTSVNSIIVRSRIGKIGYLTDRNICDPVGLINPDIINYYMSGDVIKYYQKVRPDYFIGNFDELIGQLPTTEVVKIEKGFILRRPVLLRDYLSKNYGKYQIKIYKIIWHDD